MAFEVSAEDLFVVMCGAGSDETLDECREFLERIDQVEVERAALWGSDIDEQTNYAHQEIHAHLTCLGLIGPVTGPSISSE